MGQFESQFGIQVSDQLKYKYRLVLMNSNDNYRGIVAVSMDILQMDINQCPAEYHVPNAFKNTHKCDAKTSYVIINIIIK